MAKRLLHEISPTGVHHHIELDNDGNGFTAVEFTPDSVEGVILDDCAQMRNLHQNSRSAFKLAARVPIGVHTQWKREWMAKHSDTWTWQTFLAMKLNSSEYKNLRAGIGSGRGAGMKL